MDILVCVKQVPDTNDVKIDPETKNLIREGIPCIMNPYDENGMELALSLRDLHGGKVTALSMGPKQAEETLYQCLRMGADEAILLSDGLLGGSDTLATGYALSKLIKTLKYDLIICGAEAIDGCTGQVGPIVAENLKITQFTYVREISVNGGIINVVREVGKFLEYYEAELPVLICVLKGINKPRNGSGTDKKVKLMDADDLNLDKSKIGSSGSPTKVVKIEMSERKLINYVVVEDNLSAEDRVKTILNGGIKKRKKINLCRGNSDLLAQMIFTNSKFNKYIF